MPTGVSFERNPSRWLPVLGGAGLLLAVVSVVVADGEVGSLEEAVFRAINDLPDLLYPVMYVLQLAGVIIVGPIVAIVALVLRRRRLALAAIVVTVGKLVGERLIKMVVERERPYRSIGDDIETRGDVPHEGFSFTSGHVILTVALATVVAPYVPRRWLWIPWAIVVGNAVARMYVGAHNPLDVVGGACIGAALGAATNLAVGTPPREEIG